MGYTSSVFYRLLLAMAQRNRYRKRVFEVVDLINTLILIWESRIVFYVMLMILFIL